MWSRVSVGVAAALLLGAFTPAAGQASVTVGSLLSKPTDTSASGGGPTQPTYVAVQAATPPLDDAPHLASPVNGTVTAWRLRGVWFDSPSPNVFTLRVLQPAGSGFVGAGSSAPQTLPDTHDDVLREFGASIPIRIGYRIGLTAPYGASLPAASDPFARVDFYDGFDDGDPSAKSFGSGGGELQLNAEVVPTNTFTLSAVQGNRKTGTASLTATFPNPGGIQVGGSLVTHQTLTASTEGAQAVTLFPSRRTKKRLKKKGKASGPVDFTFTPSFGTPTTETLPVALAMKRKKRR